MSNVCCGCWSSGNPLTAESGGRDPEKDWVNSLVDWEPVPLLRAKLDETAPSGGNLLLCWLNTWGWLNWEGGAGGWFWSGVNGGGVLSSVTGLGGGFVWVGTTGVLGENWLKAVKGGLWGGGGWDCVAGCLAGGTGCAGNEENWGCCCWLGKTPPNCRERKQKISLIHKLANRWRTVSKISFVLFTFLDARRNQGHL